MTRVDRRRDRERGATLLEASVIAPVLLVLVLGAFEFGSAFRDSLTLSDSVAGAARSGALQGPDVVDEKSADFEMIKDLREGTNALPIDQIERIVIFDADNPTSGSAVDQVPQACKTATSSISALKCNVYADPFEAFYAVQQADYEYFLCINGNEVVCGWDPESRNDDPRNPQDIDYVGVYIKMNRQQLTGLFGNTWTLSEASVVRLEPGSLG